MNPQPTGAAGLPMFCPRVPPSSNCGSDGCGPTVGGSSGGCLNGIGLALPVGGGHAKLACIQEVPVTEPV